MACVFYMEDGGGVIGWGYEISCVLGREGVYTGVYYANYAAAIKMKCNGSVLILKIASNTTKVLGLPYSRLYIMQLSLLDRLFMNLTVRSVT